MPELKQTMLGKVLTDYYLKSLGGFDNWNNIRSFQVWAEAVSETRSGNYMSIFKKPNYYKIKTTNEEFSDIIAFDGNKKWRKQILGDEVIYPEVSNKFRRTSHLPPAIHLLYPFRNDKCIYYKGTERKFNAVCHKISIFTEDRNHIDYFFDVETSHLVAVNVTDMKNENETILIHYLDYRLVSGTYFSHKIRRYSGGKLLMTLMVKQVAINIGVFDWMFKIENSHL